MRILEFKVEKQRVFKNPDCDFTNIVANSVGYLYCKFDFKTEDWDKCEMKIASFFVDYSSMGATVVNDEGAVGGWLTAGRDQSLVVRNMVDSMFSPKTNIGVDVKLVATGTLLPSVLSNQGMWKTG